MSGSKTLPILSAVALVGIAVVGGVLHMQSANQEAAQRASAAASAAQHAAVAAQAKADTRAAERARDSIAAVTPRVTPVIDQILTLRAKGYAMQPLTVPPGAQCHLDGSAAGVTQHDDFSVVLLTQDTAVKWEANGSGATIMESAKGVAAPISVDLPAPGQYDLVLSNRAAWILPHKVQVKAELRCTTNWPPKGATS